jgi:hypothetical protein
MYRYCKAFGSSPSEYDERSFSEVTWLLKIDEVYQGVEAERKNG